MATTLIIARHGNTFGPNDTPTRVGARTDLDLVESGRAQASELGKYFKENDLLPEVIFTSHLKRTIQMTEIIMDEQGVDCPCSPLNMFNEIDYGPDENKTEAEVIARIGAKAIVDWDHKAIVPQGWTIDRKKIVKDWQDFAIKIEEEYKDKKILVMTSNGIARFAPYLTSDFKSFTHDDHIKLKTGAFGILHKDKKQEFWKTVLWNKRP